MKKLKSLVAVLLSVCLMLPVIAAVGDKAYAETGKWIGVWGSSTVNSSVSVVGMSLQDVIPAGSTIRIEIPVTSKGAQVRFKLSNEYGAAPIVISAASVADTDKSENAAIKEDSSVPVTFNHGETSVTIPAGETIISDNIRFSVSALSTISLSLYFSSMTYITSAGLANGKCYLFSPSLLRGSGSQINSATLSGATELNISSGTITYHTIPFLSAVETYNTNGSGASTAVFIGDSTLVNDTWINYAQKLLKSGKGNVGIVNEAVVGNKLLSDGSGIIGNLYGKALINRFSRDVLSFANVKYCFVKIGLNDVLHQFSKSLSSTTPKYTVNDIINGYKTLISYAHNKGVKIYFFTKSAWNGYERSFLGQSGDLTWNATAQKMCDELDKWIKSENGSDGYIDCSKLADPSDPTRLRSQLTTDGAHLSSLGAVALADLIPLEYVGGNSNGAKTCAQIMQVDPYKSTGTNSQSSSKTTTKNQSSATTEKTTSGNQSGTQTSTTSVQTTEEPAEQPATQTYVPTTVETPSVTVAYEPAATEVTTTEAASAGEYPSASGVKYVVNDDGITRIGSNVPIGFILVLFTSIIAAAAVIILTIGKKKEQY